MIIMSTTTTTTTTTTTITTRNQSYNLETPVKLLLASLEQFDVAGGVDGVAEVGVLPLGQVKLLGGSGLHLLRHQRRTFQLGHLMERQTTRFVILIQNKEIYIISTY